MKRIEFGANSTKGTRLYIDPARLLDTRLLVMASSGGGKSYALRKLVECLHGQVQIILLDIEGEFGTLRSHYPFVVAGKGGDIAADPRYADPMARKLLELRADTIIDLYELKQHERIRFVRLFLESMVNAPKELWHPVVVVLDEAHIFAPEKGSAESLGAVIDMASRGRKRGFCLVAATQRLSKLHKDVAAECQNKLIGLANLGLDRKRAAEELGLSGREEILAMRDLRPGDFLGVGPAFDFRGLANVRVGQVKTAHPKSGAGRLKVHTPAPSAKVKAMLTKLAELPKETEQAAQDLNSFKVANAEQARKIGELKSMLEQAKVITVAAASSPEKLKQAGLDGYELGKAAQRKVDFDGVQAFTKRLKEALAGLGLDMGEELLKLCPKLPMPTELTLKRVSSAIPTKKIPWELLHTQKHNILKSIPRVPKEGEPTFGPQKSPFDKEDKLSKAECSVLAFLSMKPGETFHIKTVGAMSGYRQGGSLNNALGSLNSKGYITRNNGQIGLNPNMDQEQRMFVQRSIQGYAHTLDDWIAKLSLCERLIYEFLLREPGVVFPLEQILEAIGRKEGGSVNNALGRLNTIGLITRHKGQGISLNTNIL